MLNSKRIVFLGTPEFAVASLDAIMKENFTVAGVVTAPDKPAGRGMNMHKSAVKVYAEEKGLALLQPEKLKNDVFLENLKAFQADIQVVVAFRMLPEVVWNMPVLGTVNLHASLLPQYRGAAPINWAIINGEKTTGVTTFKLQHEIDTGNVLLQEAISIHEHETAGELHDRMKNIGASLLVKTLHGIFNNNLTEKPQNFIESNSSNIKLAPKIYTEQCRINWELPVEKINNLIRGLSPFPGAFTFIQDKMLKIYRGIKEHDNHNDPCGSWKTDGNSYLKFACNNGYFHVEELQLEGKKRMAVKDFLRGFRM